MSCIMQSVKIMDGLDTKIERRWTSAHHLRILIPKNPPRPNLRLQSKLKAQPANQHAVYARRMCSLPKRNAEKIVRHLLQWRAIWRCQYIDINDPPTAEIKAVWKSGSTRRGQGIFVFKIAVISGCKDPYLRSWTQQQRDRRAAWWWLVSAA
jgi:hypothetical protein